MAYQGIGTGTLPNDNTGDNLRDAGIKINDNFSEIYNHFGDGTNLTAIVGTGIATESGLVGAGVTLIDFRGSAVGEVVVESGIATITVSDFQESLYGDSDVDTHLNVSFAGVNEVLSWNGSDYDWVSNAGYTNSNVDTHLNQSTATDGQVLSWNTTSNDYAWVDQSTGGGGGATDLNSLTDVTITNASSGQVLKYNGSNWVNDTDATGGSGGISGVVVQEEGSDVGTATTINFVGTGVTATFDSGIATVSIAIGSTFSGDYTDLTNKPTIPADTGDLTNNVGFITAGGSGAGLTALTGATQGTYGNATNSAQIEVDANGRITSISAVAISGGGGGSGISGINVLEDSTSVGVTTHIAFNDNLTATSIGNTVTVSVTGITGINTDTSQNTYGGIGVATNFGASATSNTLFGYIAGSNISSGSNNAFFGSEAGKRLNGNYNTALGAQSLSTSVTGISNVAVGYQAGKDISIGSDNVFVGAQAARLTTDSNQSVALGAFASAAAPMLNRSIGIGDGSCYQGGTDNIGIGVQNLQKGGNNTGIIGIGYRAARYCAGDYSIHIGVEAGRGYSSSPYTTGDYNLSLGYQSLYAISSGSQNIAIGHSSGGVTTGSNNIILGNNVQVSSGSTSNQVIIGDSNITKFSIPGIGVTLKDNGGTPTQGHVLTVDANGEASFAAASGGGGGSGDYSEVAGIATYTSEWTLGADGTNNYTFTGPGLTGAENDPALYLTRGQQYKFYNNSGGHPFRIQSTPNGSTGTQYNDGIPTNDVGAGSTLTWDVQFDAPNKLYYQCTSHPDMGGPIYIIPRTEPAVGVRTEVSGTTGSVGAGATTNLDIDGFKSYGLLKVGISSAAWVRLYVDTASRTSDASRSYLTDPSPGSGLIAEVRTETAGISTFLMTPGVIGWNNEVSIGSSIYAAVTNNESSSATITVDLTVVKMED